MPITEARIAKNGGNASLASPRNHRVLMVVGDFVPVSCNSTFRALGYVEELPGLGWDPFVLTSQPDLSIWPKDLGLKAGCSLTHVAGNVRLWQLFKRCPSIIPEALLADRDRSWIPFAVARGLAVVLHNDIEVVFGSFQPWSALVAAYLISRLTRRPLVAEFRDPVLSVLGEDATVLRRLALTRRIAVHAKATATTSEEIADDITRLSEDRLRRPPLVLPHGFRRDDYRPFCVPPVDGDFVLTFTGSLYRHEAIKSLCAAMSRFLESHPQMRRRVRLKIVGRQKEGAREFLEECAREHGIEDSLEFLPWQSQDSLRAIISGSHAVWCTDTLGGSGAGVIIPGKLAKMFACGRPLLALCRGRGATWRAVHETETGECFEYGDIAGIQGFLSRVYAVAIGQADMFQRNEANLSDYSFYGLGLKLTDLFQSVLSRVECDRVSLSQSHKPSSTETTGVF